MQHASEASIEDPSWLAAGRFVDSDHPAVVAFAEETVRGIGDPREAAVALYYRVRDEFRYDPYGIDRSEAGFRASWVLAQGRGFCVPKATLLAAAARAVGIPARLGFADVRNHLTSAKLAEERSNIDRSSVLSIQYSPSFTTHIGLHATSNSCVLP